MRTRKIPIRPLNVLTLRGGGRKRNKRINSPSDETKNDNNSAQIMRTI